VSNVFSFASRQHRNDLQTTVLDALDSSETSRNNLRPWKTSLGPIDDAPANSSRDPYTTLGRFRQARDQSPTPSKTCSPLELFIRQPDRIVEHHEMRKTAKHLAIQWKHSAALPGSLGQCHQECPQNPTHAGVSTTAMSGFNIWTSLSRTRRYGPGTTSATLIRSRPSNPGIRYLRENRRRQRLRILQKIRYVIGDNRSRKNYGKTQTYSPDRRETERESALESSSDRNRLASYHILTPPNTPHAAKGYTQIRKTKLSSVCTSAKIC
jgi:hypothetical protein